MEEAVITLLGLAITGLLALMKWAGLDISWFWVWVPFFAGLLISFGVWMPDFLD